MLLLILQNKIEVTYQTVHVRLRFFLFLLYGKLEYESRGTYLYFLL